MRRILADPEATIPALVSFANSDLGDLGSHILTVIGKCQKAGLPSDRLYTLISPRTIHLAPILAACCRDMLANARCQRERDLINEANLACLLASHLQECGDIHGALEATQQARRVFRRAAPSQPRACADWVVTECLLSKQFLDAGDPRAALRIARSAVKVAARVRGPLRTICRGQALIAEGTCLIATKRWREAEATLKAARAVWRSVSTKQPNHRAELAHSEMFLASAARGAGNLDEAQELARSSHAALTEMLVQSRGHHLEDYLTSLDILISILAELGDRDRVRRLLTEATGVLSQLARSDPARYGHRFLWAIVFWTRQQDELDEYDTAMELAQAGLRELTRLERRTRTVDPECAANLFGNMAQLLLQGCRERRAEDNLARAHAWLRRLPRNHPRRAPMKEWLGRLRLEFGKE